ncbi:MAG: GDP-mannose 4,6-dehydratase [Nanoarchaeota archaeon]
MKRALISGITGQNGSYLAEFLLDKGYEVYGMVRRASTFNTSRINHLFKDPHEINVRLHLVFGDLDDSSTINRIIREVMPDEIYNLGAQSHVRVSFDIPEYTGNVTGLGATRILETIHRIEKENGRRIKYYQASSSEMFGKVQEIPQKENTPFYPRSPYGVAKLYAYWITRNYREAYNIFACNGILFNNESPRRGETFVTRKITRAAVRIKDGIQDCLYLGNLDAQRDWGHARDYIEAMWLMLQQDKADDYIIATGETHSVREFLELAFKEAGVEIESNGKKGIEEEYLRKDNGETIVKIDPRYFRPTEVDILIGDSSKARRVLGWEPKIRFHDLIKEMIKHDAKELSNELYGSRGKND